MLVRIILLFVVTSGAAYAQPVIAVLPFEEKISAEELRTETRRIRQYIETLIAGDGRFRIAAAPAEPELAAATQDDELASRRTSSIDFFIDAEIFSTQKNITFMLIFIDRTAKTAVKSRSVVLHRTARVTAERITKLVHEFMDNDEVGFVITKHWGSRAARYEVGDPGPTGGIIFYVKPTDSEGWRYMEAAPGDLNEHCSWNDAELLCAAFRLGSVNDWYLPGKDELELLYRALAVRGIGNFSELSYWSSTSSGETTAWFQRFDDGKRFFNGNKLQLLAVRAIRKLL